MPLLELCFGQKELLFLCIFLSIFHNTSHSISIIFYCFYFRSCLRFLTNCSDLPDLCEIVRPISQHIIMADNIADATEEDGIKGSIT